MSEDDSDDTAALCAHCYEPLEANAPDMRACVVCGAWQFRVCALCSADCLACDAAGDA